MTIAQTQPATSEAERLVLQHVVVLHRHGDRSPVFESSGANLRVGPVEKQFWTEQLAAADQLAELSKMGVVVGPTPDQQPAAAPRHGGVFPGGNVTKRGLARMQRVGEKLRERYGDFIDPSWSNDQVFVESTNFFRTIQSCQSLLAGLFPPSAAPDRAPFFIRTNEFDSLSPSHPMDVYDNLEARLEKDLTAKYGPGGYDALRERAYASLGADRSKPVPWSAARDIIDCNRAHEVPIPTAIPDAVVAEICEVDCWMWHQLYGNLEFCRQFFRKGVREVFGILEQAAKQTSAHKLAVLSAHDSSIVSLLKMLHVDLPTDSVPTYGSTLCIETYIDPVTNAAFVKLDLNDNPLMIGSSALRASKDCDAATSSTGMTPFREVEVLVAAFFAEA